MKRSSVPSLIGGRRSSVKDPNAMPQIDFIWDSASQAERRAIATETPRENILGNSQHPLTRRDDERIAQIAQAINANPPTVPTPYRSYWRGNTERTTTTDSP